MGELFVHDRQLKVQLEWCVPHGIPLLRSAYHPRDRGEQGRSGAGQEGIKPHAQLDHVGEAFKALRFLLCQCAGVHACVFFLLKLQPSGRCFQHKLVHP